MAASRYRRSRSYRSYRAPDYSPVVDAGEDKIIDVGQSVEITATATAMSGQIQSIVWKENDVQIANTLSFVFTSTESKPSVLTLFVTNSHGKTTSDIMVVRLNQKVELCL